LKECQGPALPAKVVKRMKRFNHKHYIRKVHRYLGFFIGVQFVLWTIGGLYFSWTDLDEIHGDHLRRQPSITLELPVEVVSPSLAIQLTRQQDERAEITKIRIVEIMGEAYYAIEYRSGSAVHSLLFGAKDGNLKPPVSRDEAQAIARSSLVGTGNVQQTTYLTADNVGKHHEYRAKPLPAWAVEFENDVKVYLDAETGQIEAVRTTKWRVFDFLWMLHTMDFNGRDNINNYILRAFSLLGIVTVLSGFVLFFVTSRYLRRFLFAR
jgi:uncharacterized iron-regulated membrane protein